MHFTSRDGAWFAPERIDEGTTMPPSTSGAGPVLINMRGLKALNSYGTRGLVNFVRAVGPRGVRYLECPTNFVDALNIVRDLLGESRDPRQVVSFSVPHFCEGCSVNVDVMCQFDQVKPDAPGLGLPPQRCPRCGVVIPPDVVPEEYLAFIVEAPAAP